MVILPLDPNLDTILLTDASRLHGIGFTLIQIKGNMRLIQFASSSLTPTHQRYTVCKLECMAVQWAIKKSDFYLNNVLQLLSKMGTGKNTLHCRKLSRVPVFSAAELDEDPRDIEDTIHCLRISSNPALNIITGAAEDNAYEYTTILNTLSISESERERSS